MNNKRIGNQMERRVANTLYSKGYWVHRLQDNHNGQPFDIVSIKYNKAFCIECKHCIGKKFNFSRIEQNQRNAFYRLKKCGSDGYIALQFGNDNAFYIVNYKTINDLEAKGIKNISEEELQNEYSCIKFNYC